MLTTLSQEEFKTSALQFLNAVSERDYKTFLRYFREDIEFQAVLPDGKVFNDVSSFLESQKTWFEGTTGSFNFKLQKTVVSSELGAAFALINYKNVDASGVPFNLEIYTSFIFCNIDGNWILIHDQNTVLNAAK